MQTNTTLKTAISLLIVVQAWQIFVKRYIKILNCIIVINNREINKGGRGTEREIDELNRNSGTSGLLLKSVPWKSGNSQTFGYMYDTISHVTILWQCNRIYRVALHERDRSLSCVHRATAQKCLIFFLAEASWERQDIDTQQKWKKPHWLFCWYSLLVSINYLSRLLENFHSSHRPFLKATQWLHV